MYVFFLYSGRITLDFFIHTRLGLDTYQQAHFLAPTQRGWSGSETQKIDICVTCHYQNQ